MSDIVPRLDTIEFAELVEQARGDIPRYAPGWTDHNLHDPGMTLIDLFAWVVDQQVYRTGLVGGRHHRAFAALLGQRSRGPTAAGGLIWPRRRVGGQLRAGTRVTCRQHPDLGFVLERSLYLPPVLLTSDPLGVDGAGRPATPGLPGLPGRGCWTTGDRGSMANAAVSLRFDGPLGLPTASTSVSLGIEVAPLPGPPPSADRPWGPVGYSYRVGQAARWIELEVTHDSTAGLARTGAVTLTIPPARTAEGVGSEIRLSFDRGFFPLLPQIRTAAINVIPVVQHDLVAPTPLPPGGTGQPDQTVELEVRDLVPPPSMPDGPVLEVEVVSGFEPEPERWVERSDFLRSGPNDRHYVVQPGHLLFGNGVNGRRPETGAQIRHTGLARTRGTSGNLRRDLSWSLPALGVTGSDFGRNPQPLTGGTDPTEIGDLAHAAQAAARRRSALLTDAELAAAASGLAGMAVGRAEVLAGFDHRMPDRRVPWVRTLVVVPQERRDGDRGAGVGRAQPGQAYLDEVASRLDERRVLGERLLVQGPVVVPVNLALTITTERGTVVQEVRSDVETAIRGRLAAVAGPDGDRPWPMGRDLTTSDVHAIAAQVSGVADVLAVRVAAGADPLGAGPVRVPPDGLVVADQIEIVTEAADGRPRHPPVRSGGGRGRTP